MYSSEDKDDIPYESLPTTLPHPQRQQQFPTERRDKEEDCVCGSTTTSSQRNMTTTTTTTPPCRKYGDIISAITFLLLGSTQLAPEVLQYHSWQSYTVATTHATAVVVGFVSWFQTQSSNAHTWTVYTTVAGVAVHVSMTTLNVPRYVDSQVLEVFSWLLVMLNANIDLPHSTSLWLGVGLVLTGCFVAMFGVPANVYLNRSLTIQVLLGAMAVHCSLHWYLLQKQQQKRQKQLQPQDHSTLQKQEQQHQSKSNSSHSTCTLQQPQPQQQRAHLHHHHDSEVLTIHAARVVLAGVFLYNLLADVAAIHAQAQRVHGKQDSVGASIAALAVKSCFVFAVGLVAVGAFRQNIDEKEKLELLVQERTSQLQQRDNKLHMFGLALQGSETAIAITDAKQSIVWSNPALATLAGRDESQLHRQSILHVLSLSVRDQERFRQAFENVHVSQSPITTQRITLEVMDSTTVINVEVSSLYMHNNNNNTNDVQRGPRFVVSLKDVTEAEALKRAQQMAERDAMMAKVMKGSMETLTHELRTPLQGILGMTSLLVADTSLDLPMAAKDSLDIIMASSGLLLVLINNLLDVRKCDVGMMDEFELTPTRSIDPIRDSVVFCRPLAKISGVSMAIDCDNDDGRVESSIVLANELRLQQVIINLISNAIKYAPRGSTIHIEASTSTLGQAQDMARQALTSGPVMAPSSSSSSSDIANDDDPVLLVTVRDAGPGIAPGQETRLFRKFAQLDSRPSSISLVNQNQDGKNKNNKNNNQPMMPVGQPGGTGLGLNLCLQFVQLMKGNIWVSNNPNGTPGAAFSFFLPLAKDADGAALMRPSSASQLDEMVSADPTTSRPYPTAGPSTSPPPTTKTIFDDTNRHAGLRILVVDDILINRRVLGRMLQKIGVVHVTMAESGEEALVHLSSDRGKKSGEDDGFDFVITDLQMPGGMSGLELSEEIRRMMFEAKDRPIVVGLTADTSPDLYGRCIESGMTDVFHKPITITELKEALMRWKQ